MGVRLNALSHHATFSPNLTGLILRNFSVEIFNVLTLSPLTGCCSNAAAKAAYSPPSKRDILSRNNSGMAGIGLAGILAIIRHSPVERRNPATIPYPTIIHFLRITFVATQIVYILYNISRLWYNNTGRKQNSFLINCLIGRSQQQTAGSSWVFKKVETEHEHRP